MSLTHSPERLELPCILSALTTNRYTCKIVEGVARAQLATRILYQQDIASARADAVLAALKGAPVLHHLDASEVLDVPLVGLASLVRIAASKSASTLFTSLLLYTTGDADTTLPFRIDVSEAARDLVLSKGLYINNVPVADVHQKLTPGDLIDGQMAFLRAGSQRLAVIALKETVST